MLRQKGLTLIELMIALLLSLLVMGMVISMFTSSIGGHAQAIRTMRLNQDMRIAMDMMVRDIRRAGYWAGTNAASNPHATVLSGSSPIFISATNDCILVSYDYDSTVASGEFFGYKIQGNELRGLKRDTAPVANPDCDDFTAPNDWQNLLDNNTIRVNSLAFASYPVLAASFAASPNKSVTITLDATSLLDTVNDIRTVITEEVRVRNEF
jgi:type IV pilus assembly protein PilW